MNRNDVKIMGDGTVSGGTYGCVKIMGDGVISGNLDAEELNVVGNVSAVDEIKLGKLKISGSGKFGSVQAEEIKVSGSIDIKKTALVKEMEVMGEVKAFNGIKAKSIRVRGNIEDKTGVEAEQFDSYGGMEINSLNADNIKIRLYGKNTANEIVGSTIDVIYPVFKKVLMGLLFFKRSWASLEAGNIEADRIYLERTTAASVKGIDVNIGPGCKIKSVEYKDKIFIDKSSVVEKQTKI